MIVNVLPHVLLLLDDAGPGVTEDSTSNSCYASKLGSGKNTHWTSDTEAENSPDQREATSPRTRHTETSLGDLDLGSLGLRLCADIFGGGRICDE